MIWLVHEVKCEIKKKKKKQSWKGFWKDKTYRKTLMLRKKRLWNNIAWCPTRFHYFPLERNTHTQTHLHTHMRTHTHTHKETHHSSPTAQAVILQSHLMDDNIFIFTTKWMINMTKSLIQNTEWTPKNTIKTKTNSNQIKSPYSLFVPSLFDLFLCTDEKCP